MLRRSLPEMVLRLGKPEQILSRPWARVIIVTWARYEKGNLVCPDSSHKTRFFQLKATNRQPCDAVSSRQLTHSHFPFALSAWSFYPIQSCLLAMYGTTLRWCTTSRHGVVTSVTVKISRSPPLALTFHSLRPSAVGSCQHHYSSWVTAIINNGENLQPTYLLALP